MAAPESPASTMTCSRALRLAVSAISDMANKRVQEDQEQQQGNVHAGRSGVGQAA